MYSELSSFATRWFGMQFGCIAKSRRANSFILPPGTIFEQNAASQGTEWSNNRQNAARTIDNQRCWKKREGPILDSMLPLRTRMFSLAECCLNNFTRYAHEFITPFY